MNLNHIWNRPKLLQTTTKHTKTENCNFISLFFVSRICRWRCVVTVSPGPNCSWFCSCSPPASSHTTSDLTAPSQVCLAAVSLVTVTSLCVYSRTWLSCFHQLFSASGRCVFSDSSTARYLRSSGVTAVSQQAWSKITVYSKQGFRYERTLKHSSSTTETNL